MVHAGDKRSSSSHFKIVELNITKISYDLALDRVLQNALSNRSSYVCFANSHMSVEAYDDKSFATKVNNSDLVLADGFPLKIAIKFLYKKNQDRISGMDFLPDIMKMADKHGLKIFILGSTEKIHNAIEKKIQHDYSNIDLVGCISPPFNREWDNDSIVSIINSKKPNIVLVALGCPKQEKWMADHSMKINSVLLGIGGSLPVFAGITKNAPIWMKNYGLEWLFRLAQDPKRLWKRYMITNTKMIYLILKQFLYK